MVAFAPDVILHIGPLPITNTFIHTLLVDGILLGTTFYLYKKLSLKPKGLQTIIEPIIENLYSLTESIAPMQKAIRAIFPYVATFFIFIFISNFTGLLPGVGTIGFFPKEKTVKMAQATTTENPISEKSESSEEKHEAKFIPLFRGATSDINVTLALAVISVISTHILSIRLTGIKDYLSRWISFNPINLYVGLLELIAEFTKVISLSFRLFGNIFAGEVALHTISNLFAFLAPIPFLLLESIVSIVQALVFSILTLVFMSVLTKSHHTHSPAISGVNNNPGLKEVVEK